MLTPASIVLGASSPTSAIATASETNYSGVFAEKDNCTQAYQDPITGKITNVTIATIARTSPTTWSVTQAAGLPPPPSKSTNINYFGGCKMTITDDHGGIATATISSYEFAVVIQ